MILILLHTKYSQWWHKQFLFAERKMFFTHLPVKYLYRSGVTPKSHSVPSGQLYPCSNFLSGMNVVPKILVRSATDIEYAKFKRTQFKHGSHSRKGELNAIAAIIILAILNALLNFIVFLFRLL